MLNIKCARLFRRQQRVHVIGRFFCNNIPVNNVMVTLYHKNRFGGPSLLGKLPCDENGFFDIEGNKKLFLGMVPYVAVMHTCTKTRKNCRVEGIIKIPKTFVYKSKSKSTTYSMGNVELSKLVSSKTKCST